MDDKSIIKSYKRVSGFYDYTFGQMMQFGNRVITHWRKGQCIFFRWQDLPHCTANCGHHDRWLMHVTGMRTEKFDKLLSNPNQTIKLKGDNK